MTSQAIGLAEAVGLPCDHKTVFLRRPWRWLPGHICPGVLKGLAPGGDTLAPPWPDLLISCGRRSVAVSIAIRKASGGATRTVHIQDPQVPPRCFDWVVPPRHDGLTGPNVLPTRGALHRVTPEKLAEHAARLARRLTDLPRPLVTVLIGGSNRTCRLTPAVSAGIGRQLRELALSHRAGLAITASRRTGAENSAVLREALVDATHFFWDGCGDNPYIGLLGLADHIIVTGDSVSMVSEACATGKPVYVMDLPGYGRRLRIFHDELRREGVTRAFDGRLDSWRYEPVNDTPRVAAWIRSVMGLTADA